MGFPVPWTGLRKWSAISCSSCEQDFLRSQIRAPQLSADRRSLDWCLTDILWPLVLFWACETLARVRRLIRATPAIQVNIAAAGGRQVNVTGEVGRE